MEETAHAPHVMHLPVDCELLLLLLMVLLLLGMLSGETATMSCPPPDTWTTTGLSEETGRERRDKRKGDILRTAEWF